MKGKKWKENKKEKRKEKRKKPVFASHVNVNTERAMYVILLVYICTYAGEYFSQVDFISFPFRLKS